MRCEPTFEPNIASDRDSTDALVTSSPQFSHFTPRGKILGIEVSPPENKQPSLKTGAFRERKTHNHIFCTPEKKQERKKKKRGNKWKQYFKTHTTVKKEEKREENFRRKSSTSRICRFGRAYHSLLELLGSPPRSALSVFPLPQSSAAIL